jgi:hypothetical protein
VRADKAISILLFTESRQQSGFLLNRGFQRQAFAAGVEEKTAFLRSPLLHMNQENASLPTP